jgi:hypothetical protein
MGQASHPALWAVIESFGGLPSFGGGCTIACALIGLLALASLEPKTGASASPASTDRFISACVAPINNHNVEVYHDAQ